MAFWKHRAAHYLGLLAVLLSVCGLVTTVVSHAIHSAVLLDHRTRIAQWVFRQAEAKVQELGVDPDRLTPETFAKLAGRLGASLLTLPVRQVRVYDGTGRIVWSDRRDLIGLTFDNPDLKEAMAGEIVTEYVRGRDDEDRLWSGPVHLAELYIPLTAGSGSPFGVVELYQDVSREMALIRAVQMRTWAVVIFGFLILYVALAWHMRVVSRSALRQAWEIRSRTVAAFKALASALDARDPHTSGHSERVAVIATLLGQALGLSKEQLRTLKVAALMHDIGKIGIPERILEKTSALTAEEYEVVKQHVEIGARILQELRPAEPDLVSAVRHHHERVDGKGYPSGLRGDLIPLGARIIAVADCYDAMRSERPYRPAMGREEAVSRLRAAAGTQLDRRLADLFLQMVDQIEPLYAPGEANAARRWAALSLDSPSLDPEADEVPRLHPLDLYGASQTAWGRQLGGLLLGMGFGAAIQPAVAVMGHSAASWLLVVGFCGGLGWLLAAVVHRMLDAASRDGLTNLLGTREFYRALSRAVARSARDRRPLSLLYVDVDDLKLVNDEYGHAAGDQVLVTVARTLSAVVRATDTVARVGGDEFVILLSGADEQEARAIAGRIRKALEEAQGSLPPLPGGRRIGVSVGIATLRPNESAQQFLSRADHNMYLHKHSKDRAGTGRRPVARALRVRHLGAGANGPGR